MIASHKAIYLEYETYSNNQLSLNSQKIDNSMYNSVNVKQFKKLK